jgi:hypothetical protein
MILRGEPSTPLISDKGERLASAFGGRTLCEVLGLPTLSASSGKRLSSHNTTFGGFLPELWK